MAGRDFWAFLRRFVNYGEKPGSRTEAVPGIEPVHLRVLLVVFDPPVPSESGKAVSQLFGWNRVDELVEQTIADIRRASYGYCNYRVVRRLDVDTFPRKEDGFSYTASEYVAAWRSRAGFHKPDWADYPYLLEEYGAYELVLANEVDEVWWFAFPYGGFYESRMIGPGAFWCNAPPLPGHPSLRRRFIVMGFNYERGVGEMLESFGHRAESIMQQLYTTWRVRENLWERFTRHETTHPGRAEVGTVHYAPNSERDYDWGNRRFVSSRCDNWLNFPDLSGAPRQVNCDEWGGGDTRSHHLWWLQHLPHATGETNGISNNWWAYIVDPNLV